MSVAGEAIDNGTKARAFASYMRIHALEASGGLTYSQMPRFATEDGKGTNDAAWPCRLMVAGRQLCPQPVGDRDRAQHRSQRELHGRVDLAVRDRRRHRSAALRDRLWDPGCRRSPQRRRAGEGISGKRTPKDSASLVLPTA